MINNLKKSKLFKSFSVYFISGLLNSSIGFLLIPIFTKYLTTEDYGTLSMFNIFIGIFSILIMLGADGSIRREFYELSGKKYSKYFSSAAFLTILSFLFLLIVIFIFSDFIAEYSELSEYWLYIALITSFFSIITIFLTGQYRVENNAFFFAVINNSLTATNLVLGLFFVVILNWNFEGRAYSLLITNALFGLICLLVLGKKGLITKNLSKTNMKETLNYGLPLIPHKLGAYLINYSDKFFIVNLVNLSANGVYSVGYTVGSLVGKFEGAFSLAFIPILFEELKKDTEHARRKIVKISYLFLFIFFLSTLILIVFTDLFFNYFIDKSFSEAKPIVKIIAIGYFFSSCYKIFTGYIFYSKKTIYLTYISIINIILSLLLNYLLISQFGIEGAAYATLISFFIMFIITAFIANYLIPMPWFYFLKNKI